MPDGFYANPPQIIGAGGLPQDVAVQCGAISDNLERIVGAFSSQWGTDDTGRAFREQVDGVTQYVRGVLVGTQGMAQSVGQDLEDTGALYASANQVTTEQAHGLTDTMGHIR
jgi:ABC-type transporter Mla subunit MlaD